MINIQFDTTIYDYPDIALPRVWTVRNHAHTPPLQDVESAAREQLQPLFNDPRLKPGASVAVGVGSRGVANIALIARTVVAELKARGCKPFIVPAMGSHGGATVEGQVAILHDYGVTPEYVGTEIRATMEAVHIASLEDGYPVYFDRNALEADAVIVLNRVKAHTDFAGELESGLGKMCAIGLGKRRGAESIHSLGASSLARTIPRVARKLVETTHIVGGLAMIENQFGQTSEIHAVLPPDISGPGEKALLKHARSLMPRLPFDDLDVLIVDEMGKDISGTGMDTHVIGRVRMPTVPESEWDGPNVRLVCVLDLTDRTHGNASGLGLADMVTKRLIERTDFNATLINGRTSGEGGVYRSAIPLVLRDAAMVVRASIGACGCGNSSNVKMVRIPNTEHIATFQVTEALLSAVRANPELELLDDGAPIAV